MTVEANKGCQFSVDGTGTWIQINFTSPIHVYLNPYNPTTYKYAQEIDSANTYTVGTDFDIYLNNDEPDSFHFGIINPDSKSHAISAYLY